MNRDARIPRRIQVFDPVLGVVMGTGVALGAGMGVGLEDVRLPVRIVCATPTINRSNRLVAISGEGRGVGRGVAAQTLGAYTKLMSPTRSRRENRLMAINKAPYGGLVVPCREVFQWETDACPTSVTQGILLKASHQPSARGSSQIRVNYVLTTLWYLMLLLNP